MIKADGLSSVLSCHLDLVGRGELTGAANDSYFPLFRKTGEAPRKFFDDAILPAAQLGDVEARRCEG